jgi:predicted N-formylglutamate amidohydrolase
MSGPERIAGSVGARLMVVADHASNAVPDGIDLGVAPDVMNTHIAVDIGAGALARAIAVTFEAPAIIATVSRLVIDLNRDPDAAGLIPESSDGQAIPGNAGISAAERKRRLAEWHGPYHAALSAELDARPVSLIVAMHSFTPSLASRPDEKRPWEIGILHNNDSRAALLAIAALRARGLKVGDNEPYSGRLLNYTMDRHAEARGLPYLGLEIRQDLLLTPADVARWRDVLTPVIGEVLETLK